MPLLESRDNRLSNDNSLQGTLSKKKKQIISTAENSEFQPLLPPSEKNPSKFRKSKIAFNIAISITEIENRDDNASYGLSNSHESEIFGIALKNSVPPEFHKQRHDAYTDILKVPTEQNIQTLFQILEAQYKTLNAENEKHNKINSTYTASVLAEISQQFSQYNHDILEINKTERAGIFQRIRFFFGYRKKSNSSPIAERKAAVKQMSTNENLSWLLASFIYQTPQKTFDSMWVKPTPASQFFYNEYIPASKSLKRFSGYMKQYYPRAETTTSSLLDTLKVKKNWYSPRQATKNEMDFIHHDILDITRKRSIYSPLEQILLELKEKNILTLEQTFKTLLNPTSSFWKSDLLLFLEKLHEQLTSFSPSQQQAARKSILISLNLVMIQIVRPSVGLMNLHKLANFANIHPEIKLIFFKNLAASVNSFSDLEEIKTTAPIFIEFQKGNHDFQKALFEKAIENIFNQQGINNHLIISILANKNYVNSIKRIQKIFDKYTTQTSSRLLAQKFVQDLKTQTGYSMFDSTEEKWRKKGFKAVINAITMAISNKEEEIADKNLQKILLDWETNSKPYSYNAHQNSNSSSLLFQTISTVIERRVSSEKTASSNNQLAQIGPSPQQM